MQAYFKCTFAHVLHHTKDYAEWCFVKVCFQPSSFYSYKCYIFLWNSLCCRCSVTTVEHLLFIPPWRF